MNWWFKSCLLIVLLCTVILNFSYSNTNFAHAANANLFVSAENPLFDNSFAGPMVIEVVISDPDISDIFTSQEEPDVTLNGQNLRMVQTVDGNWYAYFVVDDMAQIADSSVVFPGFGLDFGEFCQPSSLVTGISLIDSDGFAIPRDITSASNGIELFGICNTDITSSDAFVNHVVREYKQINLQAPDVGQVDLDPDAWPFIQLYQLALDGLVEIKYNKDGNPQQINLVYLDDADGYADLSLDRYDYPNNAQVHVTITDFQLNIDPTDEDSWTFGTNMTNPIAVYQAFDENGVLDADGIGDAADIHVTLSNLNFDDNGVLLLDLDANNIGTDVLNLKDNDNQAIIDDDSGKYATSVGGSFGPGTQPVTITETQNNSGIFTNFDESKKSNIIISSDALRGTTGTIEYNDNAISILVRNYYGSVDIQVTDGQWNSGESALVTISDQDANLNSKLKESMDISDPNVPAIPSMKLGNPFTLNSLSFASLADSVLDINDVQRFSERAMIETSTDILVQDGHTLVLRLNNTFEDLFGTINDPSDTFNGFNFFNYDITSLQKNIPANLMSFDLEITDGSQSTKIVDESFVFEGLVSIDETTTLEILSMNPTSPVKFVITLYVDSPSTLPHHIVMPIVADFFSFGIINDGLSSSERINDVLLRLEPKETGTNTGIFIGSLQFNALTQANILDEKTYDGLKLINNDGTFVMQGTPLDSIQKMKITNKEELQKSKLDKFSSIEQLNKEKIQLDYNDLDQEGLVTPVADQQESIITDGIIYFDKSNYEVGQTAIVTLEDKDLNTDDTILDIYVVVSPIDNPTDPAKDTIGKQGLGEYFDTSFGSFGRIVDIAFDEQSWISGLNGDLCDKAGTPTDGLFESGFELVETNVNSGVFTGDFVIPDDYCDPNSGTTVPTNGTNMKVRFVDFSNKVGNVQIISDSANISNDGENSSSNTGNSNSENKRLAAQENNSTISHGNDNVISKDLYLEKIPAPNLKPEIKKSQEKLMLNKITIPEWVKNTTKFWIADKIDDKGFIQIIEYLVKEKIITVYNVNTSEGTTATQIPSWIKNNAKFWTESNISDEQFAIGIEWLIKNGIIKI